MYEYIKGGKMDQNYSPSNNKSPVKRIDVVTRCKEASCKEEDVNKWKRQHIASITGDARRANASSKRKMKLKFVELMEISKKRGDPKRSILGFRDSEKVHGNPEQNLCLNGHDFPC